MRRLRPRGLGRDAPRATQLLSSRWLNPSPPLGDPLLHASQSQFLQLSHRALPPLGSLEDSVRAVPCAETRGGREGGRESKEAISVPMLCGLVVYPAFLSTASPALKASSEVSAMLLRFSSLSMAAPSGPATKDHRRFWNALVASFC